MIKAHNANGQWVYAANALRTKGQYYCPECGEPVSAVLDSEKLIDHFRHHPDSVCVHGALETVEHETKKLGIFSDLAQFVGPDNVKLEYRMDDGQRPDVFFQVEDQGVAVEIQHSRIGDRELAERTASYASKGVACLWMPDGIRQELNGVLRGATHADLQDYVLGISSGFPRWMWRIANMTDGVAFDYFSDEQKTLAGTIVGVSTRPSVIERHTPKGVPYQSVEFLRAPYALHKGMVRKDIDDEGNRRALWIPHQLDGTPLVSVKGRREQQRREIADNERAYVGCTRKEMEMEIRRQIREAEEQKKEKLREIEREAKKRSKEAEELKRESEQSQWGDYLRWIEGKRMEQQEWVESQKLVDDDDVLSPLSKELQILFLAARKRHDESFAARKEHQGGILNHWEVTRS